MKEKILMNIEYCFKRLKHEYFIFITLILSYVAMLIVPICILGIEMSFYNYNFTYIPKKPGQTYTVDLHVPNNEVLDPQDVKAKIPSITNFSMTQSQEIALYENNQLFKVIVDGADENINQIMNYHLVRGVPVLDSSYLNRSERYCWIGSQLYNALGKPETVQLFDETYHIAGVVHNQQLPYDIILHSSDYLKHFPSNNRYTFQVNATDSKSIETIFAQLKETYQLVEEVTGGNWTAYKEHNTNLFLSMLTIIIVVSLGVLTYGMLNIMTIMLNKVESQATQIKTQLLLGISKGQLYFQEVIQLSIIILISIVLDFVILILLQRVLTDYLGVYFSLNGILFGVSFLFSSVMCAIVAGILMSKQLSQYR